MGNILLMLVPYAFLAIALVGTVICYTGMYSQKHWLYRYGFWSFGLFLISQVLALVNTFIFDISPEIATYVGYIRYLLWGASLVFLAVGFYQGLALDNKVE